MTSVFEHFLYLVSVPVAFFDQYVNVGRLISPAFPFPPQGQEESYWHQKNTDVSILDCDCHPVVSPYATTGPAHLQRVTSMTGACRCYHSHNHMSIWVLKQWL